MSFRLEGPYPGVASVLDLPNPELTDTQSRKLGLDIFRAIDGTKRTYVFDNDYQRFSYTFRLSYQRAEALKAFVRLYLSSKIRMTNHLGDRYVGFIQGNPVEWTYGRALVTVPLLFEVKDG